MFRIERRVAVARRSFLSRLGAGLTAGGAMLAAGAAPARAQSAAGGWQPARHAQDDWLGQLPGAHRFVIDTTTPDGFGGGVHYASNFFFANMSGYELKDADLAVVIVARHNSTPFAYTDAMWRKYGAILGQRSDFTDPKTKQPATLNVYNATGYGLSLPNLGVTLDSLVKRGVHVAVCQMATRYYAAQIASRTGANEQAAYKELTDNMVGNSHIVPAGIVAVSRAQERGYSFAYSA